MPLDLTDLALKAFLRTLQITWQVPPPNHQLLFVLPANPLRRKNNSVSGEPDEHNIRLVDVSAVDASISRLTTAMEREDRSAFLREWVAFLGPDGHLSTARDSPVGMQVMAVVREEGRGVGLRRVRGGIVVLAEGKGGKKGDGEGENDSEMMAQEDEGVSEVTSDGGGDEAAPVDTVEGTGNGESAGQDGGGAAEAPKDDGWGGGLGQAVPSGLPAAPQGGW